MVPPTAQPLSFVVKPVVTVYFTFTDPLSCSMGLGWLFVFAIVHVYVRVNVGAAVLITVRSAPTQFFTDAPALPVVLGSPTAVNVAVLLIVTQVPDVPVTVYG